MKRSQPRLHVQCEWRGEQWRVGEYRVIIFTCRLISSNLQDEELVAREKQRFEENAYNKARAEFRQTSRNVHYYSITFSNFKFNHNFAYSFL